jgi:hypothetical protein
MKTFEKSAKVKQVIIGATIILASFSPALASSHYEFTWHDNIRPNGQPRSDAVFNGTLNGCYAKTGLARAANVTQAFKDCMSKGGYSLADTKDVANPPGQSAPSPKLGTKLGKNQFIDPDTGLLCTHGGWAAFCETPPADMTIRYTDKRNLNCTRTGIISVCSSF